MILIPQDKTPVKCHQKKKTPDGCMNLYLKARDFTLTYFW